MDFFTTSILLLIGILVGGGLSFIYFKTIEKKNAQKLEKELESSKKIVEKAKGEADSIIKESKEAQSKLRHNLETQLEARKKAIKKQEDKLLDRERSLDRRLSNLDRRGFELTKKEQSVTDTKKLLEEKTKLFEKERLAKLEEIAALSIEDAKAELKAGIIKQARLEAFATIDEMEKKAEAEALEKANYIIASTIQRISSDHVAENTINVVAIPNEDMKGRIIGREGRNIRSLEEATGVDLIIDDTPNAVVISCFDPVRREIARETLSRLVKDGRIHPGRIEQVVSKVSSEIEQTMIKDGERAVFELKLDKVHPELIKTLGRLRYRTSHSQNVLRHSIEVGFIAGMMAAELGQDVKLARRAGLLHDIGKALDQSHEGTHTQIGIDLAMKYSEHEIVVNSIASHHEDIQPTSVVSILVAAADALSASRPGARKEMVQNYINRMRDLEKITSSFEGVVNTFAIQAGREVRVIVKPDTINDETSSLLAKDIAKKIETEISYPGEIKVTVIRETRVHEYAR